MAIKKIGRRWRIRRWSDILPASSPVIGDVLSTNAYLVFPEGEDNASLTASATWPPSASDPVRLKWTPAVCCH